MADIALDVAKLASMTVVELRHELEKRGLEKSGLKATLVKRLEQSASGSSSVVGDLKSVKEDDKSSLKKKPVETGNTDLKVISETVCITKAGTNFVSAKGDEACSSSVTVTAAGEGKHGTSDTSADVLERMDVQLSSEGGAEQAVKGDSKDLLKNLIVEIEPVQRAIEFIADEEKLAEVSQSVKTALLKNTECCSSSASVVVCNSQVLDATQLPFDNSESVLDKSEVDVVSRDVTLKYESESELAEANRSSSDATLPAGLHSLPVVKADGRQVPLPEAPSSNEIGDAVLNEAIEVECETSSVSVDLIETPKAELHTVDKISLMKSFSSEKGNPSIPDIDAEEKSLTKDKDSSEMQSRVVSSSRRSGRGENRDRNVKDKNDRRHEEKTDLTKCLWVSGLSSITKAADLKNLFTPYGKVIGAKVVTSAKSPGAQCYGFVTMSGADEALKCIENLRKTTLHDKAIIVEKAKTDPTAPSKSKSSSSHKDSDKSKTIRSSSSRSYGSSSRSSRDHRQPERSSRRPQAATPDSQVSKLKIVAKPETIPVTETSQVSESKKAFVDEKISSAQSGTPVKARDSEKSFRKSDTTSEVNEIDSQSKDGAKKEVDANKKDRDRRESERSKDDAKSLEQLRIDRAAKIEKEKKLREERRQKEREREKQLREERRKEQEKREKERRERARREAERVRKEREKQRELEKQKEREREKERERFARERKEREEREQKEREREREQLERARLERERLERERIERERAENERLERERRERDRLEKERLEREERELQLMREREKLELLRLDRERIERLERERVLRDERRIDRGISSGFLKRSAPNDRDERSYYPDEKRTARSPPRAREDFFASAGVQRDSRSAFDGNAYSQDELYAQVYPKSDVAYQVRSERRDERSSDRRDARSFDRREERSSEKRDERSSDKRESRHEERRSVASRDDSRSWLDERRESRSDYRLDHRSDELRDGRKDRSRHDRDYQRGRASPGDVRRVASEDRGRTVVTRDRSPIRSTSDRDRYSRHEDHYESRIRSSDMRERDWIDAPNASAPKTLSDVLGRAGLTGILGSQAEELAPRLVSASGYGSRDEDDGLRGSSSSGRRDLDDRYSRPLLSRDAPVNASVHEVELPGLKYELPTSVICTVAPVTQAVTQFSVVSDRSRGLHNLTSDIAQRGLASLLPSRLVPLTAAFARPLQPVAQASPAAAAIQAGYAAAVRGLAIHHAAQAQLRNSRLDLSALRQARPGLQIPPRRF